MDEIPKANASVKDVAEHFGVSESTVWRWLKNTDIPHRKVGDVTRFSLAELDEWARHNSTTDNGADE